MKRLAIILTPLFLLLLLPVGVALAAPPFNSTVVEAGERINNNIILFDGNLDVEADSVVNGDVILFNGSFTLAGQVNGDVVLFNGDLVAAETAVINGDCVLLNGAVDDQTAGGLGCTQTANLPALIPNLPPALLQMPAFQEMPSHSRSLGELFGRLAGVAGNSLLMGFLAFVAVALLPDQVNRTTQAIRQKPGASGVIGLLTAVAIPSLIALLLPVSIILSLICIGLLGFPVMFALAVGLGAGLLLGWISLGHLLAGRIAAMFNLHTRSRPVITAFSTTMLTLTLGLLALLPGGFIVTFAGWVLAIVGLGAVALTQFGTRPYPLLREMRPNADKVTAVLETLPVEETQRLKEEE
jgi:hypothetical protein